MRVQFQQGSKTLVETLAAIKKEPRLGSLSHREWGGGEGAKGGVRGAFPPGLFVNKGKIEYVHTVCS